MLRSIPDFIDFVFNEWRKVKSSTMSLINWSLITVVYLSMSELKFFFEVVNQLRTKFRWFHIYCMKFKIKTLNNVTLNTLVLRNVFERNLTTIIEHTGCDF